MTILHAGEIGRFDEISVLTDTDILMILRSGTLFRVSTQEAGLLFRNDRNITEISFSDSPYTVLKTDEIILANASGGEIVINLLPLVTALNRLDIHKTDSTGFDIVYDGNGTETINNELTQRILSQNDNHTLFPATLTNWIIL